MLGPHTAPPSSSRRLLDLPNEILTRILEAVDGFWTLQKVMLVCRRLKPLAEEVINAAVRIVGDAAFLQWLLAGAPNNAESLTGIVKSVHVYASDCRELEHNFVDTLQKIASTRPLVKAKLAGVDRLHCEVHCMCVHRSDDALQDYLAITGIIDATHIVFATCWDSTAIPVIERLPSIDAKHLADALERLSRLETLFIPYVDFGREDDSGFDALLAALDKLPVMRLHLFWPTGLNAVKVARLIAALGGRLDRGGLVLDASPDTRSADWRDWCTPDRCKRSFLDSNPGVTGRGVADVLTRLGKDQCRDRLAIVFE